MTLRRAIIPVIITVLLIGAALVMFTGGSDQKTVTAYFPRTISIYEGSDVRVLGVPVGTIDTVEPEGTRVKVTMSYDSEVRIPSQAEAVIISPSIVGDRYVQLTPVYATGMLRAGTQVEVVSRLLGHASVTTTVEVYGHLSVEDARQSLEQAGWFADTGSAVQL